jgi:putative Holliday junction resolvase
MNYNEFDPSPVPRYGRLLGIDFGTRRIGLAISTPEQNISSPLDVYYRKSEAIEARDFREIVAENRIVGCVVGLPLHASGDESNLSYEAREFGAWLSRTVARPVAFWDERYSSSLADDWMLEAGLSEGERKLRRDKLAAHVILQSYLDRPQPEREQPPTP